MKYKNPYDKRDISISRRGFLTVLGAATIGGGALALTGERILPKIGRGIADIFTREKQPVLPEYPIREIGEIGTPTIQLTGILEGETFNGDMYGLITGLHGRIPSVAKVDFKDQIEKLWDRKLAKYPNNNEVRQARNTIVEDYDPDLATCMTLDDYIHLADTRIGQMRDHFDWDLARDILGLSESRGKVFKEIGESLNGRHIICYGLTEMFERDETGIKNLGSLDFILRNAGIEYVGLIPSLWDKYLSKGLFQFTSFAVNGAKNVGASRLNTAVEDGYKIKGSVIELDGVTELDAAYLFALSNIGTMLRTLGVDQMRTMRKEHEEHPDDIVKFIATAHHNPRAAVRAAKYWLDNDADDDFTISCSNKIVGYSRKTDSNWGALNSTTLAG